MKPRLLCLLAASLSGPAVGLGDKLSEVVDSVIRRDEQLQASFLQFPLLTLATNPAVKLDFHALALDKPVIIDGINFYGFRFKVPKRTAQEDFVWSFGSPSERHFWYITPETGSMAGFEEFFREQRASYEGLAPLFPNPLKGKELVIQRLSGDALEDDKRYLIWFAFGAKRPARISVAFVFADLRSKKANRGALEMALGLHRK